MVWSRYIMRVFLAACAGLGATRTASAEGWFYLDPISLEAEIRFDGSRRSTNGVRESEDFLAEELLLIRQTGYGWDPAISNFSIELIPLFRQDVSTQFGEKDTGRGNDLNYAINLGFLQGARGPVDLNINSSRTTHVNDAAFALRNETDISDNEVMLNWKNAYFPLQFRWSKGSYAQVFDESSGATRAQRDEDRTQIVLKGSSSKLDVELDSEDVVDNARGNDYGIDRAWLRHHFNWGSGSILRSLLSAYDRSGFNPFRQLSWSETATIHHTDSLWSTTAYHLNSQEAVGADANRFSDTLDQDGIFELEHSLYENLSSNLRLVGRKRDSDLVDQVETEFGGGVDYRKTFFSRLDVSASVNGYYGSTDRVSEAGIADAVNERHVADYVDLIILGEPLVVAGTVIVTADDGFAYLEGFDYEILPFGALFTELRIIPSGRISIGETLFVSYQYDPFPSANFDTLGTGYALSLSYGWLRIYHDSSRTDNELNTGSIIPPDRRDSATGIELNFRLGVMSARLGAESRYRQIGGFENDALVLKQVLSMALNPNLNLSFTGNEVFNDASGVIYPDPRLDQELQRRDITSDYYAFDAMLNWTPRSNLRISPSFGYWRRKEEGRYASTLDTDRRYLAAGLRVSWFVRKLTVEAYYRHNDVDTSYISDSAAPTTRVEDRLMFSIRRQFR